MLETVESDLQADLLTIDEAAKMLKMSTTWVRHLCREGVIVARKLPGSRIWRVERKALEQLIRS